MVKRTSCLASNEKFRVRFLVGLLDVENLTNGRATRLATGPGWKPAELYGLAGSTPAPSAVAGSGAGYRRQTVNLFGGGSIPLGHPEWTLNLERINGSRSS